MTLNLKLGNRTAVVDTYGGELVSYRDENGTEYIWNGDPAHWKGRNPLLFPIVGRLTDGQVRIAGGVYEMQQHGFARTTEFTVAESGENYVVFELCDTAQTLAQYPYHFCLRVCHELTPTGFVTRCTVENTDSQEIHFCIGGHTGFMCPFHEGETFEDYSLVFEKVENLPSKAVTSDGYICPTQTTPGPANTDTIALSRALFNVNTLVFEGLQSQSVSLRHNTKGCGVKLDFAGFPTLAFWSPFQTEAPFLCIEPWFGEAAQQGESGEFTDKPHCIHLGVGKNFSMEYSVTTL